MATLQQLMATLHSQPAAVDGNSGQPAGSCIAWFKQNIIKKLHPLDNWARRREGGGVLRREETSGCMRRRELSIVGLRVSPIKVDNLNAQHVLIKILIYFFKRHPLSGHVKNKSATHTHTVRTVVITSDICMWKNCAYALCAIAFALVELINTLPPSWGFSSRFDRWKIRCLWKKNALHTRLRQRCNVAPQRPLPPARSLIPEYNAKLIAWEGWGQ